MATAGHGWSTPAQCMHWELGGWWSWELRWTNWESLEQRGTGEVEHSLLAQLRSGTGIRAWKEGQD